VTIHVLLLIELLLQTYQGALDMLENVYIKTGGTDKCFGSDAGGHGSGETIALQQGALSSCPASCTTSQGLCKAQDAA
jgi:hypothetical protein